MAKGTIKQGYDDVEFNQEATNVLYSIPKADRLTDIVPRATVLASWALEQLSPCGDMLLHQFNKICCSMFVHPESVMMRLQGNPKVEIEESKFGLRRIRLKGDARLDDLQLVIPDASTDAHLNYPCCIGYIMGVYFCNTMVPGCGEPNDGVASQYIKAISERDSPEINLYRFATALYYATKEYRNELKPYATAFLEQIKTSIPALLNGGIHPCTEGDGLCKFKNEMENGNKQDEIKFDMLPVATAYARYILAEIKENGRYQWGKLTTLMLYLPFRLESLVRRLPCVEKIDDPDKHNLDYLTLRGNADAIGLDSDLSPDRFISIPKPVDDAVTEARDSEHEIFMIFSTNPPMHHHPSMSNPQYALFFYEKSQNCYLPEEVRLVALRQFLQFTSEKSLKKYAPAAFRVLNDYHFVRRPAKYCIGGEDRLPEWIIKYLPEVPK